MYRDQFGEFVCVYWGLKGFKQSKYILVGLYFLLLFEEHKPFTPFMFSLTVLQLLILDPLLRSS